MKTLLIRLKTIDDIRRFVDTTNLYRSNVELVVDNYTVDGKSIMGIFSLDLKKTVTCVIDGDDCAELCEALAPLEEKQA